jgi:hypothetical protein
MRINGQHLPLTVVGGIAFITPGGPLRSDRSIPRYPAYTIVQ